MIVVPRDFPLVERMKAEGIHVSDVIPEGGRSYRILILNLMPLKQDAELELYHGLDDNSEYPIEVKLVKMSNMTYRSTPQDYMDTWYEDVAELMERNEQYDGLIVNGAPFGHLEYEQVIYWRQLTVFFRWADKQVNSHLYICWGAFARIFYNWGVRFVRIGFQWSGVYPHHMIARHAPFTDMFPDDLLYPISRPCYISRTELEKYDDLEILAESPITGPSLFLCHERRQVYAISHPEYAPGRLNYEYHRDLDAGLQPMIPYNYYQEDDTTREPIYSWKKSRDCIFRSWLKNYVF